MASGCSIADAVALQKRQLLAMHLPLAGFGCAGRDKSSVVRRGRLSEEETPQTSRRQWTTPEIAPEWNPFRLRFLKKRAP